MTSLHNLTIAIVGLGLMGGSYAKALRRAQVGTLLAVDIDDKALSEAIAQGDIDEGFSEAGSALQRADLVIVALYPRMTVDFIARNLAFFKPGCVITDVSGVKATILGDVMAFLRDDIDFVGGHPMAGSESRGFGRSSQNLFAGASYLITPHPKNRRESLELVRAMAMEIGCRKVRMTDPAEHDRAIACTSQLPHVIAAAFMACAETENGSCENLADFMAGSYRDLTRIADFNEDLWAELMVANRTSLLEWMEEFENRFDRILEAVGSGDAVALRSIFADAARLKKEMNKHEAASR
jgi:prephenate dehydrogenase